MEDSKIEGPDLVQAKRSFSKFQEMPRKEGVSHKEVKEEFQEYTSRVVLGKFAMNDCVESVAVRKVKSMNCQVSEAVALKEYEIMKIYVKDASLLGIYRSIKEKESGTQYTHAIFLKYEMCLQFSERQVDPEKIIPWLSSLVMQLIRLKSVGYVPISLSPFSIFINTQGNPHFGHLRYVSSESPINSSRNESLTGNSFNAPELKLPVSFVQSENIKSLYTKANIYSMGLIILNLLNIDISPHASLLPLLEGITPDLFISPVSELQSLLDRDSSLNPSINSHITNITSTQSFLQSCISQIPSQSLQDLLNLMLQVTPKHRKSLTSLVQYLRSIKNVSPPLAEVLFNSNSTCRDKLRALKALYNFEVCDVGAVTCCAIAKNSQLILTGGSDGNICIWSIPNNNKSGELKGHNHSVVCIKITSDEKIAVSGGKDSKIRIWDLTSKKLLKTLSEHQGFVVSLTITYDDKFAVSGSEDGGIAVWNLEKKKLEFALSGHETNWREKFGVTSLDIVKNKKNELLVSGGEDGCLRVWRLPWKCQEGSIEGHISRVEGQYEGITCLVSLSNGEYAVSGGEDGYLRVWDLVMKSQELSLQVYMSERFGGVRCLAVTSDDRLVLSGGRDGRLFAFNLESREIAADIQAHKDLKNGGISCIALSFHERYVVTGGIDCRCVVWSIKTWTKVSEFVGHTAAVGGVYACGEDLVSTSLDGSARVWDLSTGLGKCEFRGHFGTISLVDLCCCGRYVATSGARGGIKVWSFKRQMVSFELEGHVGWVSCLFFYQDCKYIVSAGSDKKIRVWNVAKRRVKKEIQTEGGILRRMKISRDGGAIFAVCDENRLGMWNWKNLQHRDVKNLVEARKIAKEYPEIMEFTDCFLA